MKARLSICVLALAAILALPQDSFGQEKDAKVKPVEKGEKTAWHGFDRYDFVIDEQTLEVKPSSSKAKAAKGQRPCIVVVPKTAAPGNPWSWQACYWDHEPQTEVELLKRGFHIAFVAPEDGAQARQSRDKVWDAWYKHLTEKHGLAKRAAFVGMSKGGVNEYNWGLANPEKVACIYADNPALWDEDFAKLPALAKHDVPLLHICGSEDFLVDRYTRVVEGTYHSLGGLITVIIKDGHAHHRHSLQNPKLIADWIEQHMTPSTANKPTFVDATYTKGYYYSLEPKRIYLKEEDSYATARGPGFTECYDRYDSPSVGRIFKKGGISIIVPNTVAPGKLWVFTGDSLERDATVEQALLAKGYHIVIVSPLDSGFTQKQWDDAYKLLVDNGFSKKPVLKGIGPKAGEAYAWAVANPDKVSSIYARNPLMKSIMAKDAKKQQPIDNLAPLAKLGVPILHDSGALDPWLESQTRVVEKRYKELDGRIMVIVREGEGHFPLSPKDPKSVVDFILSQQSSKAAESKLLPSGALPANNQPKLVIPPGGSGQLVRVEYPPSTAAGGLQVGVTYTLWVPNGVTRLRGVIVHQHGAGTTAAKEGSTAAYDLHWQALAKKWDCALLGPSYHVLNEKTDLTPGGSELWFDPRRGSEKTFLKALGELAAKSGHPELQTVPWALWGHSGGAIWSDVLSTLYPERVAAIWLRSGSAAAFRTRDEFPQPQIPAAVYAIPIMANAGVKEKSTPMPDVGKEKGAWWGSLATFREYRAKGAPIGFAQDPRTGHECGDARYLAIPFFDACLAMRLPDKGSKDQTLKPVDMSKAWLASVAPGDAAVPAADFKGKAEEAVWLPNEAFAKAWMEYVKSGAVSDTTPPPAPFNVQVTAKAEKGTEIVWSAEADFESGIRCFIVLRDGQELVQVPKTPKGQYGRPLFQSMTYHDTPSQPMPEMRYFDLSAKPGEKHIYAIISVNSVGLKSKPSTYAIEQKDPIPKSFSSRRYQFDKTISREVLENYLARAISMEGLLNGRGDLDDNIRMLKNTGAKFVGRALCLFGGEAKFLANLERAKQQVPMVLKADPEMILQACVFEIVTTNVEKIPVPDWAFTALGQPVEKRNFHYAGMLYPDGKRKDHWGKGASVPDVSQPETKLWFYYQAASYIDLGFEAIHFGQTELMNGNDRKLEHYEQILTLIRSHAAKHSRRHLLICDSHVPSGGLVREGRLLMDFHSFPLRIKEVPDRLQEAKLEVGFSDSIYGRSKGGLTFSGWKCDYLPYLVELDNFGASKQPGKAKAGTIWVWGYDEITWFAHQSKEYRSNWLRYAWDWVSNTDPNGHLQMPGSRTVRSPLDKQPWYFANNPSAAVPNGLGDEKAIKAIWEADNGKTVGGKL